MCGLAGTIGANDRAVVETMLARIRHRGPDGEGYMSRPFACGGMVRLAIVDVSRGMQPFRVESAHLDVMLNGEIFNHMDLRKRLEAQGALFVTDCDTEVVAKAWEAWGPRALRELEGQFSLAIFESDKVFLCRDEFGIKPLYILVDNMANMLWFASEVKSIVSDHRVSLKIDPLALADFDVLGYCTDWQTCFEGIKSLPPGHYLEIDPQKPLTSIRVVEYSKPKFHPKDVSLDVAIDRLHHSLSTSVQRQIPTEVLSGVALSGGVDSTLIADYALSHRPEIGMFNVSDDLNSSDRVSARRFCGSRKSGLQEIDINRESYFEMIPELIWALEKPLSLHALPVLALAKGMAGKIKVVLSGEGADELFGGYHTYISGIDNAKKNSRLLDEKIRSGLNVRDKTRDYINILSHAKSEEDLTRRVFGIGIRESLVENHLQVYDGIFMAEGLECRVPFLDPICAHEVLTLPQNFRVDRKLGIQKKALKLLSQRLGMELGEIALRTKIGLPSAGFNLMNLMGKSLSSYRAQHQSPSANVKYRSGLDGLVWDIFHEIFVVGRGRKPGPDLLPRLIREGLGSRLIEVSRG